MTRAFHRVNAHVRVLISIEFLIAKLQILYSSHIECFILIFTEANKNSTTKVLQDLSYQKITYTALYIIQYLFDISYTFRYNISTISYNAFSHQVMHSIIFYHIHIIFYSQIKECFPINCTIERHCKLC